MHKYTQLQALQSSQIYRSVIHNNINQNTLNPRLSQANPNNQSLSNPQSITQFNNNNNNNNNNINNSNIVNPTF